MPSPMPRPIDAGSPAWLTPPNDPQHQPDYPHFADGAAHPFDAGATAFSLRNACWLADASLLAYSAFDVVRDRFHDRARMVARDLSVGATQCVVAEDAEKIVVAFRGTQVFKPGATRLRDLLSPEVLRDWLTDAHVRVVVDDGRGGVHRGFLAAFAEVWPGVAAELARLASTGGARPVWFTGHSLGGALATLAALRWERPAQLYTYGSPRVGDAAFRAAFGARPAYRFVHAADLVPTVPKVAVYRPALTSRAPGRFVHVGERLELRDDGVILRRPPEPLPATGGLLGFAADVLGAAADEWLAAPLHVRVADHAPIFYASLLWNTYLARGEGAVQRKPRIG